MKNYYQILGLVDSASADEIRRAYRILARRYHPDVNPGKDSLDKFKDVAEAYECLSVPKTRKKYDREWEKHQRKAEMKEATTIKEEQYERLRQMKDPASRAKFGDTVAEEAWEEPPKQPSTKGKTIVDFKAGARKHFKSLRENVGEKWEQILKRDRGEETVSNVLSRVSIVEVSLKLQDSIRGLKKTIEINDPQGERRVSVFIPPGVRDGSVLRMRNKNQPAEDLVLIVRLASHPFLTIRPKGLIVDIPISVKEALYGAQIKIPGIDEELLVKVPPGTQSGTELRLKGKGIAMSEDQRGDLFIRFLVKLPEFPDAVGLKEKVSELDQYYGESVRHGLPKNLLEG